MKFLVKLALVLLLVGGILTGIGMAFGGTAYTAITPHWMQNLFWEVKHEVHDAFLDAKSELHDAFYEISPFFHSTPIW